jgi:hypothetical protein
MSQVQSASAYQSDLHRNKENGTLLDPYLDWAEAQGIPIHEDFGIDLLAVETGDWPLYGARGALAHVHGRGDYTSAYVVEVPAGGSTRPIRHLYEAFFYGLSGRGSTVVWTPDGSKHTFEWGPKALFCIPLNCRYRIFNGSGRESARLACTHDLPLTMNLFHNEEFVFDNPSAFPERVGSNQQFEGDGTFIGVAPGRHMWETNYVPDLTNFELKELEERGKGSTNITFILGDGTLHAHVSEIPARRYKKAHRHGNGIHIYAVTGHGYSCLWYEGDAEYRQVPWRHGVMYAPPHWMFHQHFNTAPEPARYLAVGMGSRRYPFVGTRRKGAEFATFTSIREGGRQIEYGDQDPRFHRKWLEEIARTGVTSIMGDVIDEKGVFAFPPEAFVGPIRSPRHESLAPTGW